ncbi:MAG: hypothetical protein MJ105_09880 [Lachnospiraceae bacterium]|nr:hypothetical protein [Lachnospiraceae bacterium]
MKKKYCCLLVLLLILITGCSASKATAVYEYRTTGDDIVPSVYLVKTEYYPDKVVIYWDGTVSSLEEYHISEEFELQDKKMILKTDQPLEFNSFSMGGEDFSYFFRYLDSEQYACLYSDMDSEGGMHYSGSIDRYYTDEEKEKQSEQSRKREEEQKELFEKLEGTWVCDDGDYLRIYKDEDYAVEYSVNDTQGNETSVYFKDHLYAKENNIGISYIDGPFEAMFAIVLAEDGNSFEYSDKIFVRE